MQRRGPALTSTHLRGELALRALSDKKDRPGSLFGGVAHQNGLPERAQQAAIGTRSDLSTLSWVG